MLHADILVYIYIGDDTKFENKYNPYLHWMYTAIKYLVYTWLGIIWYKLFSSSIDPISIYDALNL